MSSATLRPDAFAPRQPAGMRSGLVLALIVHALLILAIAWGVRWKASEPEGVVAELWSAVPQVAAPRPTPPPPEPKPTPVVEPKPAPPPPVAKPTPVAPQIDPQIAIEKAKREQAKQEEAERVEAQKKAEKKRLAEQAKKDEAARREEARRAEAERERQRVAEEQAEKKKLAEQAKKDEARQAALREANLKRMMRQAGTSENPDSTGTAARTSGPSSGYAGRIKARIKPNIVLTSSVAGNPSATVEVRVAPDGTIIGRKLVTSSGVAAWDETVLRAIDKTEVLPKDVDGRVPPTMTIAFRPLE
ncbi:MAG: cell envelope integrity protein TolA [Caldimonas sp.]